MVARVPGRVVVVKLKAAAVGGALDSSPGLGVNAGVLDWGQKGVVLAPKADGVAGLAAPKLPNGVVVVDDPNSEAVLAAGAPNNDGVVLAPKAGVEAGVPNKLPVLAPNALVVAGAPNAVCEAPNAVVEPNPVLKEGLEDAPNRDGVLEVVPKRPPGDDWTGVPNPENPEGGVAAGVEAAPNPEAGVENKLPPGDEAPKADVVEPKGEGVALEAAMKGDAGVAPKAGVVVPNPPKEVVGASGVVGAVAAEVLLLTPAW